MGFRLNDYHCDACENEQEELVWNDDEVPCAKCGAVMRKMPPRFRVVIEEFLGQTKIKRGETIDVTQGTAAARKQWDNS